MAATSTGNGDGQKRAKREGVAREVKVVQPGSRGKEGEATAFAEISHAIATLDGGGWEAVEKPRWRENPSKTKGVSRRHPKKTKQRTVQSNGEGCHSEILVSEGQTTPNPLPRVTPGQLTDRADDAGSGS